MARVTHVCVIFPFKVSSTAFDLYGSSWLKDCEMGEIVGEFVFGAERNPRKVEGEEIPGVRIKSN